MALQLSKKQVSENLGVPKHTKAKKCRLERIRRQRINDRLEKLKIVVMKHLGNDIGFYPPMEKADILELAIRCLEGKENVDDDMKRLSKGDKSAKRKPLGQLTNGNTRRSETKRRLEETPSRENFLLTTTRRRTSTSDDDENIWTPVIGQSFPELKQLLDHPIKCFRESTKSIANTCMDNKAYYALSEDEPSKTSSSRVEPIWRPWTV